jgi:hypothetical protein
MSRPHMVYMYVVGYQLTCEEHNILRLFSTHAPSGYISYSPMHSNDRKALNAFAISRVQFYFMHCRLYNLFDSSCLLKNISFLIL